CAVTVTGSGRPVAPVRARAAMVSRYPPLALPAISQPASIEASHSPSAAGWTAVALANGPVRGHLAQTGIRAMLSSGAAPPAAAAAACAAPALQPQPARPQPARPQPAPPAAAAAACAAAGRSSDGTLVDRELDRSGAARAEHQAAAERSRPGVARQPDA